MSREFCGAWDHPASNGRKRTQARLRVVAELGPTLRQVLRCMVQTRVAQLSHSLIFVLSRVFPLTMIACSTDWNANLDAVYRRFRRQGNRQTLLMTYTQCPVQMLNDRLKTNVFTLSSSTNRRVLAVTTSRCLHATFGTDAERFEGDARSKVTHRREFVERGHDTYDHMHGRPSSVLVATGVSIQGDRAQQSEDRFTRSRRCYRKWRLIH